MPIVTLNAKRKFTLSKVEGLNAKNLFLVSSLLFLVTFMSGCSAVGYSKPAALQVTSTPETAVFLDGKHVGKTPFYSDQLKAGQYTIKVTATDASYVDKITLSVGTLTVVNRELNTNFLAQSGENLTLISGEKGVFIISNPKDADITIDGRYIAKTPFLAQDLEDGDHKVQLTKTGYVDREFAIKSSPKFQLLANVTLASKIAKGIVTQTEPKTVENKHILILNTPQGFLKVRKEPALSAAEVGQVNSGEEFEVIQEVKDWYQISIEGLPAGKAGKLGWISATYAKKVE